LPNAECDMAVWLRGPGPIPHRRPSLSGCARAVVHQPRCRLAMLHSALRIRYSRERSERMNRRTERVNDLLREQLDQLLRREAKDPRLASMWSITDVEVTRDLRHAKVYVSVLGSEEEARSTMAGLNAARGFLRRELGHRLNTMHHIPEITFKRDTSIERGMQLSGVLDELKRERESGNRESQAGANGG
jgi:ribosome-binding factor A